MKKNWILGSLAIATLGAAWACGGATTGASGNGDAGVDATGGGSGSGTLGADGGSSGSGSGGSSSSSSSGGVARDSGTVVEGGTFRCGQGMCSPPDVCCLTFGGTVSATCEAQSLCTMGIAQACTAESCPAGSLCCGAFKGGGGGGGFTGSSACVMGTTCPSGDVQACSMSVPCPAGDRCSRGGFCRPIAPPPDGGVMDSGTDAHDAGAD